MPETAQRAPMVGVLVDFAHALRAAGLPVGTGEATNRSAPSRSQATAAPTMSAIESAAPTS